MTNLRPRRALLALPLLACLAVACSTGSSPDAGAGAEAGGGGPPPNQFGCPNGGPGTRAAFSSSVCAPQKTETYYTCPNNAPASVCFVAFTYACGLPPGSGPFAADAGDAGQPTYNCAALCPELPFDCSVEQADDGGTVMVVRCGGQVCGA